MLSFFEKHPILIALIIITVLLSVFFFSPAYIQQMSVVVLIISISLTLIFTVRRHLHSYQNAECTREKMIRNILRDLLGLVFTMGAAMYVGRSAGNYFGLKNGFWAGLAAGFAGGFTAAWCVQILWRRLFAVVR